MKRRVLAWLTVRLGPLMLAAWFSTIRFRWYGEEYLSPDPRTRRNVIFAFWHQRLLCFTYTHAGQGSRVLISRSRDGELMAEFVRAQGFVPVRGSSLRAGSAAVRQLLTEATRGYDIGITPDGPRGPRFHFKSGAVYLAARTGLPIVPLTVSFQRHWEAKSWDAFQVPWPFTRAVVHAGAPVAVPPLEEGVDLEAWRERLEQILVQHTRETDARFLELYREGRSRRAL